jgi:WD40 repeat protein
MNALVGHKDFVTSLSFVTDSILLSGAADGTCRLWDVTKPSDSSFVRAIQAVDKGNKVWNTRVLDQTLYVATRGARVLDLETGQEKLTMDSSGARPCVCVAVAGVVDGAAAMTEILGGLDVHDKLVVVAGENEYAALLDAGSLKEVTRLPTVCVAAPRRVCARPWLTRPLRRAEAAPGRRASTGGWPWSAAWAAR